MVSKARRARHAEVAGAGFAGLTAALALRLRGWSVRVHERGEALREFGAGILVWYNGLRVLEELGALKDVLESSVAPPYYETRKDGAVVSVEDFDGLEWRAVTRQDLYRALLSAAVRSGVELVSGSEVVRAEPDGRLRLASGECLDADLIVGADGVRSRVRESAGLESRRHGSHDGIVRLLVPRSLRDLGDGPWDNVIDFWNFDPRVLRVLYVPCNSQDLYIALMAPAEDAEGSRVPIDVTLWTSIFPQLTPLIEAGRGQTGRYTRYETTYVPRWTSGRIALVGDSAHAMCPALAQGAGCAMVNAYTLAAACDEGGEVQDVLASWESRIRGLTDRCQERSAHFAETRSMANGSQFTNVMLETARFDPREW